MCSIKPQNVMYQSTNPGHSHTQYKTMQWHDRRCPHASQWPKPAYQMFALMTTKEVNKWVLSMSVDKSSKPSP